MPGQFLATVCQPTHVTDGAIAEPLVDGDELIFAVGIQVRGIRIRRFRHAPAQALHIVDDRNGTVAHLGAAFGAGLPVLRHKAHQVGGVGGAPVSLTSSALGVA